MASSHRLLPVLRLEKQKEDQAALALGYLNQQIDQERSTLSQLENYQREYLDMMSHNGQAGQVVNIQSMMRYQQFVERLEKAQHQQHDQIEQLYRQHEQVKAHWVEKRARVKALESLIERDQQKAQQLEMKREQKQLDEFSNYRFARQTRW